MFYSDNLHVDRYIQCQYFQDLTLSLKPICKPFPESFFFKKLIFNLDPYLLDTDGISKEL